jgi:hypothetical protein
MFIPTMQAIGLGGGSLVNSAICARSPDFVFDKVGREDRRRGLTRASLDAALRARRGGSSPSPPRPSRCRASATWLQARLRRARLSPASPRRATCAAARARRECFTGCRNGAKQSTDVSYVPAAIRAGARVYTSVRAEQLLMRGRASWGVRGHVIEPFTWSEGHAVHDPGEDGRARGRAACRRRSSSRRAAWATQALGRRELQLHPGLAIMAIYDTPIDPWKGATQGYHSLHFLEEGIKLEVLWSPPAVLAARLPGLGHDYQRHLMEYDRMAPFDVIIATDRSRRLGAARADAAGTPDIRFELHAGRRAPHPARPGDPLRHLLGLGRRSEILPGLHGVPEMITRRPTSEIHRDDRTTLVAPRDTDRGPRCEPRASAPRACRGAPKDGVVDEVRDRAAATRSTTSTSPTPGDLPGQPRGEPDAHLHGARPTASHGPNAR